MAVNRALYWSRKPGVAAGKCPPSGVAGRARFPIEVRVVKQWGIDPWTAVSGERIWTTNMQLSRIPGPHCLLIPAFPVSAPVKFNAFVWQCKDADE